MANFFKTNLLKIVMIIVQMAIIVAVGLIARDIWYSIIISAIGVIFNALVSFKVSYGFLFGCVYAILSGFLAYTTKVYATFAFMIVLQAPMAIYSFFSWKKNVNSNAASLKTLSVKWVLLLATAMFALGVGVYFILGLIQKSTLLNLIFDTIFFVFSVSACLLLAFRFKCAYVVTLLSGLGGSALWIYQMIATKVGLSVAAFYIIVSVNSVIAIYKNYFAKPIAIAPKESDEFPSMPSNELAPKQPNELTEIESGEIASKE